MSKIKGKNAVCKAWHSVVITHIAWKNSKAQLAENLLIACNGIRVMKRWAIFKWRVVPCCTLNAFFVINCSDALRVFHSKCALFKHTEYDFNALKSCCYR